MKVSQTALINGPAMALNGTLLNVTFYLINIMYMQSV